MQRRFTPTHVLRRSKTERGFTLMEMSLALVIIGLLIGGVLLGRDLIHAAALRRQISQITTYQTAVNTFRNKYNCLPGDCRQAASFGLPARGQYAGQGDGDGVIQGVFANSAGANYGMMMGAGELQMFWVDLSMSSLIKEKFTKGSSNTILSATVSGDGFADYFPRAELGTGLFVYVYSGALFDGAVWRSEGTNFIGLSALTLTRAANFWLTYSDPGMQVLDAYSMDQKMDDALPQSGKIWATHLDNSIAGVAVYWAGYPSMTNLLAMQPFTTATSGSSTSCFDNGGVGGVVQKYSTSQSSGQGKNCALSFKLQ